MHRWHRSEERATYLSTSRLLHSMSGQTHRMQFPLLWLIVSTLLVSTSTFAQDLSPSVQQLHNERVPELQQQLLEAQSQAAQAGLEINVVVPDGREAVLQEFSADQPPKYYITNNAIAADTVSTDELHPGGSTGVSVSGFGQLLGIWDGGNVRGTHRELSGRVTNFNAAGLSDHATHVAGTMIGAGVSPTARGMAFSASLRAWDFSGDIAEMITEQNEAAPVLVSNHSYGFVSGWIFDFRNDGLWVWLGIVSQSEDQKFGFYDTTAQSWDDLAYASPNYLMVKSSGNDRSDAGPSPGTLHWHWIGSWATSTDVHPPDGGASGFDTIGGGSGSAKNVLTIGAVNDIPGGYTAPGDVVMSPFSGWGPTDDGRIKPDLVANGVDLTSSTAGSNSDYSILSGTSMSAPNTSGSLILLQEIANTFFGITFKSATIRALAIHGADDAGNVGPDYTFGWGLLNMANSTKFLTSLGLNTSKLFEFSVPNAATIQANFDVAPAAIELKVTLVWTDPAGTPPATIVDPVTKMLVNDLDLFVEDPNGIIHRPWILDPTQPAAPATKGINDRDVVEQVIIAGPASGTYKMFVSHKGSLLNGIPQNFSLAANFTTGPDADGDGVADPFDLCASTVFGQLPDSKGCSDLDVDGDGDGYCDPLAPSLGPSMCLGTDAFPSDPNEWNDNDGDLVGDNADPDDDNDGIGDGFDTLPFFFSNTCTDLEPFTMVNETISTDYTCADQSEILVLDTDVIVPGHARLISPIVRFVSGSLFTSESGTGLSVTNADPCPGC